MDRKDLVMLMSLLTAGSSGSAFAGGEPVEDKVTFVKPGEVFTESIFEGSGYVPTINGILNLNFPGNFGVEVADLKSGENRYFRRGELSSFGVIDKYNNGKADEYQLILLDSPLTSRKADTKSVLKKAPVVPAPVVLTKKPAKNGFSSKPPVVSLKSPVVSSSSQVTPLKSKSVVSNDLVLPREELSQPQYGGTNLDYILILNANGGTTYPTLFRQADANEGFFGYTRNLNYVDGNFLPSKHEDRFTQKSGLIKQIISASLEGSIENNILSAHYLQNVLRNVNPQIGGNLEMLLTYDLNKIVANDQTGFTREQIAQAAAFDACYSTIAKLTYDNVKHGVELGSNTLTSDLINLDLGNYAVEDKVANVLRTPVGFLVPINYFVESRGDFTGYLPNKEFEQNADSLISGVLGTTNDANVIFREVYNGVSKMLNNNINNGGK